MKGAVKTWSAYESRTGAAVERVFTSPAPCLVEWIDIGMGMMVGELAAATVTSQVSIWQGTSNYAGTTDAQSNLIVSVTQTGRSNATFATFLSLSKFCGPGLGIKLPNLGTITIQYSAGANHTLSGWITIGYRIT